MASYSWIAKTLRTNMRVDPKKIVRDMQKLLLERFDLIRKYHIVRKARELIMEKLRAGMMYLMRS